MRVAASRERDVDVRRIARALSTLGADARETRLRVLEGMLGVVDADHALFFSVGDNGNGLRLRAWEERGPGVTSGTAEEWEANVLPNHLLIVPGRLRRVETRSFLEADALWPNGAWRASGFYQHYFYVRGFDDQIRMLVEHEGRFYGYLGLVSHRGTPGFTRHTRRRLAPLADAVRAALVTAQRLEEGRPPGDLVCRSDGVVEHATATGATWLAVDGLRERVRHAVVRLDHRDGAAVVVGGVRMRITRLEGASVRYLVHVDHLPLPSDPLAPLSTAQRSVIERAARGATVDEIARELVRGVETVRTHLKEGYRRLDVRSRAELVERIGHARVDPTER